MRVLFSQRYLRAIESKALSVEIPEIARRKVWAQLTTLNAPMRVQRDPYDNWTDNSSVLEEAESDLLTEHGWQRLPVTPYPAEAQYHEALRLLVLDGEGPYVFDTIEVASGYMDAADKEKLRQKINQIFELHDCPWRISDGEFFKLDGDFVGARLASNAHDSLAVNQFAGAAHEYSKARQYLGNGDIREAIFLAGHSFESVMKVLTKLDHANGDRLIKELGAQGYFDDLPEAIRAGFMDQVLRALPFLRNKLGGHGQGKDIVAIPLAYGDLAIQLAAAFHNFLITKHLERDAAARREMEPSKRAMLPTDDDPPF
ncbi:conserved hypothetical protein [Agrobacterium tumefaciens str. Kerr 14]|uniref:HEPN AbiJ-N-terminal domain-containing protein n=1 Tax=Agrobacterium tumefaciens str. Kerr 14 TaxID=1183424 RepID=A0A1S7S9T7_AGRTU|nr:hypothetical protein [Agrobacterium tumefaciens]CUX65200.1 conserved hypothetical protein [Agrobacterium tumefaciens str. Kerr 14]